MTYFYKRKKGAFTFNKAGYIGNEPEKELSEFIIERIATKSSKLPQYNLLHPEIKTHDLIIYKSVDCIIDNDELLIILKEKLMSESNLHFCNISIISGDKLLYVTNTNNIELLQIPVLKDLQVNNLKVVL